MAKKKATHQNHTQQDKPPQKQDQTHNQVPTMDDAASEKLENLKSLNSMLLKEAVERRQQVDSLIHSKGSLESALTRSEMENRSLQDESTRLHDRMARLELERQLVFVFVSVQVGQQAEAVEKERAALWREKAEIEKRLRSLEGEMREVAGEKSEIEKAVSEKESEIGLLQKKLKELVVEIENERDGSIRLSREKKALRAELDAQIEETNGLALKLNEAENRQRNLHEEVQKLKIEYNGVMEEKKERERRIESILRDKDSVERSLTESNRVIEDLKRETQEMVREKEGIEEEKKVEVMRKMELETAVASLNELVLSLQKEEERMRANAADLENRCLEAVEREKMAAKNFEALAEENNEREKSVQSLIEEKDSVKKDLDEALKELDEQKGKMNELMRKKNEIEELEAIMESQIAEMQREVSDLKDAISLLEASSKDQIEKNGMLQSELDRYKDAFGEVTIERDEARKGFDEEKKIGMILSEKVSEMEKRIEETQKVIAELKAENASVIGETKELESKCSMLVKEIASLENTLLKVRKDFDEMQAKVENRDSSSGLILNMLKNTAAMVSLSKDENGVLADNGIVNEQNVGGEEVKPYVVALEAIKNAFKNRENKVEEMKREVEFLQNSVAEAHKRKSFWAMVSSATTIVAAASVAYLARGL